MRVAKPGGAAPRDRGSEADDISNLAFIGGKTNRQISHKPPVQYLLPLIEKSGSALFEAQCIPTDAELLELDAFDNFLARRRELVSRRLNEFLGVTSPGLPDSMPMPL